MRTTISAQYWTARWLAELMKQGKIYLDDAFQSYHRWIVELNQQYMRSLLNGKAPTPIFVADIEQCRNSIKQKFDENHEDYKFFDDLLKKGYTFITIDGNNRTRCITDFIFGCLSGSFPLFEEEYEIGGSITQPIVFKASKSAKFHKDLDPLIRSRLESIEICISIITTGTRKDLAELFDAINKGMTLNAQEKRNCWMFVFAYLIRDCVAKYRKSFEKVYNEKGFHRRMVDEFIVDVAVLSARGLIGFGPSNRDKAYGDKTPEVHYFSKTERIIKKISELLEFKKDGDNLLTCHKKTSANLVDLAILLHYMDENKIVYTDKKKFFEEFCNAQDERLASTETLWQRTHPKGHPNEGEPTGTDDRSYAGVQRSAAQVNFLTIRQEKLIESLENFSDGLIVYKDPKRNFEREHTFMFGLWKSQDKKCGISGKKINARDVMNPLVTEVDHVHPHSKGGDTTQSNAALVYKSENRSKSAKIQNIPKVNPLKDVA